jgi:hypothetical protein
MTFIYFTDDENDQIGVPLKSITELKFEKNEDDPDSDELTVSVKGDEYYNLTGKSARQAWEEIRLQIMATDKHRGGVNR